MTSKWRGVWFYQNANAVLSVSSRTSPPHTSIPNLGIGRAPPHSTTYSKKRHAHTFARNNVNQKSCMYTYNTLTTQNQRITRVEYLKSRTHRPQRVAHNRLATVQPHYARCVVWWMCCLSFVCFCEVNVLAYMCSILYPNETHENTALSRIVVINQPHIRTHMHTPRHIVVYIHKLTHPEKTPRVRGRARRVSSAERTQNTRRRPVSFAQQRPKRWRERRWKMKLLNAIIFHTRSRYTTHITRARCGGQARGSSYIAQNYIYTILAIYIYIHILYIHTTVEPLLKRGHGLN